MRKWTMAELNRKTVDDCKQADKNKIVVVLDNVRSMHNVGSVFRTADAFLAEAVYLCGFTPKPPHRDIHKTALGATETVKWEYHHSTVEAVSGLKGMGYRVFAIEQVEGSIPLQKFGVSEKVAIVFGNEVDGVSDEVLSICDGAIEIPQLGMKHSLNISVTTGIVLWELVFGNSK